MGEEHSGFTKDEESGHPRRPPTLQAWAQGKGGGVEGTKGAGRGRRGARPAGGGAGRGRFRPAASPGPLPQASPFMVRRPRRRGGGSRGGGEGGGGGRRRAAPGSARSGDRPEPQGARAAQVSGAGGEWGSRPAVRAPGYTQVTARAAPGRRAALLPGPDPSSGAPRGARGAGGRGCGSLLPGRREGGSGGSADVPAAERLAERSGRSRAGAPAQRGQRPAHGSN